MVNSIIPSYDVSLVRWRFTSSIYCFYCIGRHCRYLSLQICLWRYSAFSPRAPTAAVDTGVFLTCFGLKNRLWDQEKSGKESEWTFRIAIYLEACRTYIYRIYFWIKVLLRCQCRWQVLVSSLYNECSNGDGVSFSRLTLMELWVSFFTQQVADACTMHVEWFRESFPQHHPPVIFYMAINQASLFHQKDFLIHGTNVACSILLSSKKKTGILFVLGSFCHLIAHQRLLSWEFDHLASLEALTLGGDGWMEIDRNTWDVGEILVNLASFNAQLNQNSTKTPIKRQLNLSQCLILVKFWILFLGRRIPGPRARHFGSKLEFLSMGRRILFKRRQRENCLTDLWWRLFSKFSHCFFRPFWRFYFILVHSLLFSAWVFIRTPWTFNSSIPSNFDKHCRWVWGHMFGGDQIQDFVRNAWYLLHAPLMSRDPKTLESRPWL